MVRSQVRNGYTIGGLAAAATVGVETIRFYQRKMLLPIPPKGAGSRRYGETDLRRLRFIRHAQRAGFSLDEIRTLLALDASQDRRRVRDMADVRIAALDARIEALQAARNALQRLALQCAAGDRGSCPILDAFDHPSDRN
ncbi:MerR family transcriptional regulator [Flagellatimonas centrodinii]|uniref:MerR family transcriptional regulator n=1 Tax=Flagellatimonas centrodinii TaxID=2806210 RepID=UPI001FEE902A|nr:MerR family transcriptional regulator [Flagellatimonas centrodinii]